MPRACLVEFHACGYIRLPQSMRCHELVSWSFTLSATAMLIQPYIRNELHFAYCYRVYMRWRTHRARPLAPMAKLDRTDFETIDGKCDIRVLECASSSTDLLALVSLKPEE